MVGDGHPMGVAAQVLEDILGAAKGWFAVDHPVLPEEWPEPRSEGLGLPEQRQIPGKVQAALLEGGCETIGELAAKHLAKHRDGEKEAWVRSNPAGVIEREPTGGDDTVDVGMNPSSPTIP
jgi:hypothetical protein